MFTICISASLAFTLENLGGPLLQETDRPEVKRKADEHMAMGKVYIGKTVLLLKKNFAVGKKTEQSGRSSRQPQGV
jgi:hypothetical protein